MGKSGSHIDLRIAVGSIPNSNIEDRLTTASCSSVQWQALLPGFKYRPVLQGFLSGC